MRSWHMGITSKNKGSVAGTNPITVTLCGLRAWGHKAAPTCEPGAIRTGDVLHLHQTGGIAGVC